MTSSKMGKRGTKAGRSNMSKLPLAIRKGLPVGAPTRIEI